MTTKKLTLASSFDEITRIEDFVVELQEWLDFDDDTAQRILLTMSEAVTNAIVHGNKEDPSKNVSILAQKNDHRLTISVKDEGQGFDPEELPDPLKEENLLNEGGRGVFLIDQYTDDISYSENGTKLTIAFDLED